MTETVVSGEYAGYTVTDLEKLILWELGQVSGTTVSYNRFPQWLIRAKLNERMNLFVKKSQCLRKVGLLVCKANYSNYKLPSNCMEDGVIAAQYFYSATSYINLLIRDVEWLHDHQQGWLITGASTPQYCLMGESVGNIPMLMVHPKPASDGTSYTTSPETGVIIGGTLPGTVTNTTGTATGGSAVLLDDTAVDFTAMGLVAGMAVKNVTDGSKGTILSIAAHEITLVSSLTGGSDNQFAAGDSYEILSGEYGVVTSWTDTEQYMFGSDVGIISNITVPAGNIRVDYIPYPTPFPSTGNVGQYPEIPKLYHHSLAMGVVADLLATFHEQSREFQRAQWYEAKFGQYFGEGANAKGKRPFSDKPVQFVPARKR